MSLSAIRFQSPATLSKVSLSQALFEEGYDWDGNNLIDIYSDPRSLSQEDIYAIQNMPWEDFKQLISRLSAGAKYIAGRIYSGASPETLPQIKSDWAATKELRHWMLEEWKADRWERLVKMNLASVDGDNVIEFHPQRLIHLGIRFANDARRFCELYEQLCNPKRPWGSCYQPSKGRVVVIATTPNYNKLPLWVKKIVIQSPHWIETERVGNIWKFIPAAKAWKVCPGLPKAIAVRVGKLPLWKRIAAKLAWNNLQVYSAWNSYTYKSRNQGLQDAVYYDYENDCSRPVFRQELFQRFWVEFNALCAQGMDAVLTQSAHPELPRAISIKFGKSLPKNTAWLLSALLWQKWEEKTADTDSYDESVQIFNPVSLIFGMKAGAFDKALKALYGNENWLADCLGKGVKPSCKVMKSIATAGGCWEPKSALALTLTFANEWQRWLDKNAALGRSHHDATYWLPTAPVRELEGLSKWLFKFGDRSIEEISVVASRWQYLSTEERQLPYKDLVKLAKSAKYGYVKSIDFAQEAGQWGVSQNNFKSWEARFIASQNVPMPFPTNKLWDVGGIVGRFLPRNDARGLFLGHYTNCCQHPDSVGKACAWYGQESPNSGFFVWEAKGEIIAQSWCWVSDDGGLCFDNVEAKGLGDRQNDVAEVLNLVSSDLSDRFHTITLGTGLSDLYTGYWDSTEPLRLPRDYSGYADSSSQVLLSHNPRLPKKKMLDTPVWVRGALEQDLEAALAIAKVCYPADWQFVGSEETDYGIVLDSRGGVIGYATIEEQNRYISDIAVHPDHRKYSLVLINAVLNFCRFGQWKCDARESTTYKLLRLLEKRGKVKILSANVSQHMDKEPMYAVEFEVV